MCFRQLVKCLFCCKKPQEGLNETSYYEYLDSLPLYYNSQLGILTEGVSFTVTGYILLNCERFSINFILDNATKDVALHINPRLPQSYIVRNTKVKNVWGREEVSSALPFSLRRGSKFAIQVLITNNSFLISVNGYHFAEYYHRLPFSLIAILEVKGDVDNVNVDRSEVAHYPDRLPEAEAKDIRIAIDRESVANNDDSGMDESPDEIDGTHIPREWRIIPTRCKLQDSPSLHSDMRFTLPYYGQLPANSLGPGRVLKVEGRVKLLPHSFYINLQRGHHFWPHATIAFHFNPRFSKQSGAIGKAIVCRNAWVDGQWADEERSELDTDFRPGKTFSLAIVCGKQAFEVYVNRKRIVDYTYRVSPEIVDTVYIQGDIKLWDVVLENNDAFSRQSRIYQNPAYTEDY